MSNEHFEVYGNLALASWNAEGAGCAQSIAPRPRLSVVKGSHAAPVVARERQLWAPDAYASRSAKGSSVASVVRASVALVAIVFAAILVCGGAFSSSGNLDASSLEHITVSVEPGESLWSIAEDHPVAGLDASRAVELIREWNGLDSSTLHTGMELLVPTANR